MMNSILDSEEWIIVDDNINYHQENIVIPFIDNNTNIEIIYGNYRFTIYPNIGIKIEKKNINRLFNFIYDSYDNIWSYNNLNLLNYFNKTYSRYIPFNDKTILIYYDNWCLYITRKKTLSIFLNNKLMYIK